MTSGMFQGKSNGRIVLSLLPFLIAGFFAIRNLATWPARISYPGDEAYEGVAMADMVHLRQGVPIYAAGAKDGFSDGTYGPLYYLLGERLVNPSKPSYLLLRILSVLGMLGCAIGCGVLAFWLTQSYWVSVLSPLIFLAYGMVTGHGILALSDGVAVFLAFAGFLIAYRFRNDRRVLIAVPVMLLSFYYKPQYVAGPAAVMLFLVIEKRYKLAAAFGGMLAAGGLGLLAFFQFVVFPGQAYWRHFLFYQAPLLDWRGVVQRTFVAFGVLVLLPFAFGIEYLLSHRDRLIGCYLVSAVVLGVLTYSKDGSGTHYFFESVLAVSVLVPALIADKLPARVYPLDVVLALAVMLFMAQWMTKPAPGPGDVAKYEAVQSYLRLNFPPHALALSTSPGDLLQAGLDAPFGGLFQLEALTQRGVVSDFDLVEGVQKRQFVVIILPVNSDRDPATGWQSFPLTLEVVRAVRDRYRLAARFDMPPCLLEAPTPIDRPPARFYVYVPSAAVGHVGSQSTARPGS